MRLDDFYRIRDRIPSGGWAYVNYYYTQLFDTNTDISLPDWNAAAAAVVSVLRPDLWRKAGNGTRNNAYRQDIDAYDAEIKAVMAYGQMAQESAEQAGNTQSGSGLVTMTVTNPSDELLQLQRSSEYRTSNGGNTLLWAVVAVVAVLVILLAIKKR